VPATTVPATRRIRFTRVHNIDTDRLVRRLAFLEENGPALARACDARIEVRVLAREILTIRAELGRRAHS
jgi:hypothetical protein